MKSAQLSHLVVLAGGLGIASTACAQWSEDFDSYVAGSSLAGQGGWTIWCDPGGLDALVSTKVANSGPNSMRIDTLSDMVHRLGGATTGQHTFIVQTYVPDTVFGEAWINVMSEYCLPAHTWATATTFDCSVGSINSWASAGSIAMIFDKWIEYRVEIDLDADTFSEFYNGVQFVFDIPYSSNVGGTAVQIEAIDLYSDTVDGMFFDDVSIENNNACPCACDFDLSTLPGVCDIFDFLSFQNLFVAADPCACDLDTSTLPGVCDIFDFLAFQNEFVSGCP